MRLLLRQVSISDKNSPHNGLIKDILIVDGKISQINDHIYAPDAQLIETANLSASPGWVDIFSHFCDPGFEHKETLETGANAAAAGGYTHVFVLPNTKPVTDNKVAVEYIVQKSKSLPVCIYPLAAISKKTEGKEPAEMYDMHHSGAIAFSDGLLPVQSPGLMLKALQYVKAIDAVIVQMPVDASIGTSGLMNEGIISTQLGLPGIPDIAEELMVSRDIILVKYTGSKLHFTGISTAKSIQLIKAAKDAGVQVTVSVTPYHLMFCDEDLTTYDSNLKTNPPLRSRQDMMALRTAVTDGTIDCIASHHLPQDWDSKVCEFEYAQHGMTGLETTFGIINQLFPNMPLHRLIDLLSANARSIFFPSVNVIAEGSDADITLFERNATYTYQETSIKSKSRNTPFINQPLKGKVVGIINKDKLYLND